MSKTPLFLALAASSLLLTSCVFGPCSGCGRHHSQAPVEKSAPIALEWSE